MDGVMDFKKTKSPQRWWDAADFWFVMCFIFLVTGVRFYLMLTSLNCTCIHGRSCEDFVIMSCPFCSARK